MSSVPVEAASLVSRPEPEQTSLARSGPRTPSADPQLTRSESHRPPSTSGRLDYRVVADGPLRSAGEISVVIPHGGRTRLQLLRACLASLRQHPEVGQVIIAEMGPHAEAEAAARRWADTHVLIRHRGPFERARALNVGAALAECELVLWMDNDVLLPPGFLTRAVREMRERGLDHLMPFGRILYLSEADSREVIRGNRGPAEAQPVSVQFSGGRGTPAGGTMGLVSRTFLRRYGGLIEGFKGWGGEDNAWQWKAMLLGRTAATFRHDQDVHHLYHPGSGGYDEPRRPSDQNPHYGENVSLMHSVFALRTADDFLRQFPPPLYAPCPWPRDARLAFVAVSRNPLWSELALHLAEGMRAEFGCEAEAVAAGTQGWETRCVTADGLVVLGDATDPGVPEKLRKALSRCVALRPSIPDSDASTGAEALGRRAAREVVIADPRRIQMERLRTVLVEALSQVVRPSTAPVAISSSTVSPAAALPPVWAYWEGPCPHWITACHDTLARHAPGLCILTPASFEQLRAHDRDIDLRPLSIAHRADFIRAYLLAHFGGLWVDSDCIAMRSLRPTLELVARHDFVAHRERSGQISNGFIGARAGSRLATEFYRRVCGILRSGKERGWTSLGGEPLTDLLEANPHDWLELACEKIQPICWSRPEAFLTRRSEDGHDEAVDPEALSYMLSKTELEKDPRFDPNSLMEEGSFFHYLLRRSAKGAERDHALESEAASFSPDREMGASTSQATDLRPEHVATGGNVTRSTYASIFTGMSETYRTSGDESLSGPGSSLDQTAELRARLPLLLESLGIRTLLDAPCGDFNWTREIRTGLDEWIGVDVIGDVIARNRLRYGRPGRRFLCRDLINDELPVADLVLCRDFMVHLSFDENHRLLENLRRTGARYLLATTFMWDRTNEDTEGGAWRPLNLQKEPFCFPEPSALIVEGCSEGGGAYADKALGLWELRRGRGVERP